MSPRAGPPFKDTNVEAALRTGVATAPGTGTVFNEGLKTGDIAVRLGSAATDGNCQIGMNPSTRLMLGTVAVTTIPSDCMSARLAAKLPLPNLASIPTVEPIIST